MGAILRIENRQAGVFAVPVVRQEPPNRRAWLALV